MGKYVATAGRIEDVVGVRLDENIRVVETTAMRASMSIGLETIMTVVSRAVITVSGGFPYGTTMGGITLRK
jgi:hypothetical protein